MSTVLTSPELQPYRCALCQDTGWRPIERAGQSAVIRCECRPVPQPPAPPLTTQKRWLASLAESLMRIWRVDNLSPRGEKLPERPFSSDA